jgi:hypothetical protein
MSDESRTRRHFLTLLSSVVLVAAVDADRLWAERRTPGTAWTHPDPRPGIDASRLLPRERLADAPDAVPVFDMVRRIPQVVDGIRCHCGCAEDPDNYSLLSCYEGAGMASECRICQGQARLAFTMHQQGKTLTQIRAAVDARFG